METIWTRPQCQPPRIRDEGLGVSLVLFPSAECAANLHLFCPVSPSWIQNFNISFILKCQTLCFFFRRVTGETSALKWQPQHFGKSINMTDGAVSSELKADRGVFCLCEPLCYRSHTHKSLWVNSLVLDIIHQQLFHLVWLSWRWFPWLRSTQIPSSASAETHLSTADSSENSRSWQFCEL